MQGIALAVQILQKVLDGIRCVRMGRPPGGQLQLAGGAGKDPGNRIALGIHPAGKGIAGAGGRIGQDDGSRFHGIGGGIGMLAGFLIADAVLHRLPLGIQHRSTGLGQIFHLCAVGVLHLAGSFLAPAGKFIAFPGEGIGGQGGGSIIPKALVAHGAGAAVGTEADGIMGSLPLGGEAQILGTHGLGYLAVPACEGIARAGQTLGSVDRLAAVQCEDDRLLPIVRLEGNGIGQAAEAHLNDHASLHHRIFSGFGEVLAIHGDAFKFHRAGGSEALHGSLAIGQAPLGEQILHGDHRIQKLGAGELALEDVPAVRLLDIVLHLKACVHFLPLGGIGNGGIAHLVGHGLVIAQEFIALRGHFGGIYGRAVLQYKGNRVALHDTRIKGQQAGDPVVVIVDHGAAVGFDHDAPGRGGHEAGIGQRRGGHGSIGGAGEGLGLHHGIGAGAKDLLIMLHRVGRILGALPAGVDEGILIGHGFGEGIGLGAFLIRVPAGEDIALLGRLCRGCDLLLIGGGDDGHIAAAPGIRHDHIAVTQIVPVQVDDPLGRFLQVAQLRDIPGDGHGAFQLHITGLGIDGDHIALGIIDKSIVGDGDGEIFLVIHRGLALAGDHIHIAHGEDILRQYRGTEILLQIHLGHIFLGRIEVLHIVPSADVPQRPLLVIQGDLAGEQLLEHIGLVGHFLVTADLDEHGSQLVGGASAGLGIVQLIVEVAVKPHISACLTHKAQGGKAIIHHAHREGGTDTCPQAHTAHHIGGEFVGLLLELDHIAGDLSGEHIQHIHIAVGAHIVEVHTHGHAGIHADDKVRLQLQEDHRQRHRHIHLEAEHLLLHQIDPVGLVFQHGRILVRQLIGHIHLAAGGEDLLDLQGLLQILDKFVEFFVFGPFAAGLLFLGGHGHIEGDAGVIIQIHRRHHAVFLDIGEDHPGIPHRLRGHIQGDAQLLLKGAGDIQHDLLVAAFLEEADLHAHLQGQTHAGAALKALQLGADLGGQLAGLHLGLDTLGHQLDGVGVHGSAVLQRDADVGQVHILGDIGKVFRSCGHGHQVQSHLLGKATVLSLLYHRGLQRLDVHIRQKMLALHILLAVDVHGAAHGLPFALFICNDGGAVAFGHRRDLAVAVDGGILSAEFAGIQKDIVAHIHRGGRIQADIGVDIVGEIQHKTVKGQRAVIVIPVQRRIEGQQIGTDDHILRLGIGVGIGIAVDRGDVQIGDLAVFFIGSLVGAKIRAQTRIDHHRIAHGDALAAGVDELTLGKLTGRQLAVGGDGQEGYIQRADLLAVVDDVLQFLHGNVGQPVIQADVGHLFHGGGEVEVTDALGLIHVAQAAVIQGDPEGAAPGKAIGAGDLVDTVSAGDGDEISAIGVRKIFGSDQRLHRFRGEGGIGGEDGDGKIRLHCQGAGEAVQLRCHLAGLILIAGVQGKAAFHLVLGRCQSGQLRVIVPARKLITGAVRHGQRADLGAGGHISGVDGLAAVGVEDHKIAFIMQKIRIQPVTGTCGSIGALSQKHKDTAHHADDQQQADGRDPDLFLHKRIPLLFVSVGLFLLVYQFIGILQGKIHNSFIF